MRLSKITWPTAERYFKENDMVILPIGSTECHGRHMPLGTDTLIPDKKMCIRDSRETLRFNIKTIIA